MKGQLTPQERNLVASGGTTNADAYEIFLRGKQQYRQNEMQLARDLFDRAIQLDPNFADAYAWRGLVIYQQFHGGRGDRATLDAACGTRIEPYRLTRTLSRRGERSYIYHSTGHMKKD